MGKGRREGERGNKEFRNLGFAMRLSCRSGKGHSKGVGGDGMRFTVQFWL